jgi:hypothetical protein
VAGGFSLLGALTAVVLLRARPTAVAVERSASAVQSSEV